MESTQSSVKILPEQGLNNQIDISERLDHQIDSHSTENGSHNIPERALYPSSVPIVLQSIDLDVPKERAPEPQVIFSDLRPAPETGHAPVSSIIYAPDDLQVADTQAERERVEMATEAARKQELVGQATKEAEEKKNREYAENIVYIETSRDAQAAKRLKEMAAETRAAKEAEKQREIKHPQLISRVKAGRKAPVQPTVSMH